MEQVPKWLENRALYLYQQLLFRRIFGADETEVIQELDIVADQLKYFMGVK